MSEPEWNGDGQTDDVSPGDPLIPFTVGEKFVAKTSPCNSLRVVLLRLLTGPDIRPFDRQKDFFLIVDDRIHQGCESSVLKVSSQSDRDSQGRTKVQNSSQ
jgi:hypothetical protein